jgi:uncharacterized membrane protein YphA (DoxX/SURF4 family)
VSGDRVTSDFNTIRDGTTAFCVLTALTFHHNLADLTELIQFGKDFGLVGGFLFLAAGGAGDWSLDARLRTDFWPLSRRG